MNSINSTAGTLTKQITEQILSQIDDVFLIGLRNPLEQILISYLSRGHILIEGPPGTAKTVTAKLLARLLGKTFNRIQFTSDMLPSDILGAHLYAPAKSEFEFIKGPIFADVIVADEINRTPPRTQSALLEVMEERQVTSEGKVFHLSPDFFVVATQNPLEHEGTFPLPDAQLDRFLVKIRLQHLGKAEEIKMLRLSLKGELPPQLEKIKPVVFDLPKIHAELGAIEANDAILSYVAEIVDSTRRHPSLQTGSSVRGTIGLLKVARTRAAMHGRHFVIPDDIKSLAASVLGHRVRLSAEAQIAGVNEAAVFEQILNKVPQPT